jgi:hypothetical protein
MANSCLTDEERARFAPLLREVRSQLETLADGDVSLLFAYRRRLWNQPQYDERLKSPYRANLKRKKRTQQGERRNVCYEPPPTAGANLDGYDAPLGFMMENTQLLCPLSDTKKPRALGYK